MDDEDDSISDDQNDNSRGIDGEIFTGSEDDIYVNTKPNTQKRHFYLIKVTQACFLFLLSIKTESWVAVITTILIILDEIGIIMQANNLLKRKNKKQTKKMLVHQRINNHLLREYCVLLFQRMYFRNQDLSVQGDKEEDREGSNLLNLGADTNCEEGVHSNAVLFPSAAKTTTANNNPNDKIQTSIVNNNKPTLPSINKLVHSRLFTKTY